MKKFIPVLFIAVCFMFALNLSAQEYVGADKCQMCHKSEKSGQQYPLWEARKHSKSAAALTSEKAKEYSPDTPAAENPDCYKCHAPLTEKAPDFKGEGVTCEVCHGPGSEYKKMSVMKDHAEAVKAGMTDYPDTEAIKKTCLTCHENAHEAKFDFETAWEKVKHPKPDEG